MGRWDDASRERRIRQEVRRMGADMVENRKKVAGMSRLSPDASC